MSLPTTTISWNTLNSCAEIQQRDKVMRDNVFKKSVFWDKVWAAREVIPGAEYLTMSVEYDTKTGKFFSGFDFLNPSDKEIVTTASWRPFFYSIDLTLAWTDWVKAQGNQSNYVSTKYKNVEKSLIKDFGGFLAGTGASTGELLGLQTGVPDVVTGTYGNIDMAANTYWQNYSVDGSSHGLAGITLDHLNYDLSMINADYESDSTMILTDKYIGNKLEAQAQPFNYMSDADSVKWGFKSIKVKNCPVVIDPNISGRIYYLNLNQMKLKIFKDSNMDVTEFIESSNQAAQVKYIRIGGQLCVNPKFQGVRFGVV